MIQGRKMLPPLNTKGDETMSTAKDRYSEEEKKLKEIQARHRQQMKMNRDKVKERKARTHRLIVRGGMVESMISGADQMTDAEFEQVLYGLIFNVPAPTTTAPGKDRR